MKRICLVLTTITISIFSCISSFAGQWQQDIKGWWYQNDDGTYPDVGWNWIDGKLTAYVRMDGSYMQLIMIAGDLSNTDTDGLMNALIE